jgi:hypothetical protein
MVLRTRSYAERLRRLGNVEIIRFQFEELGKLDHTSFRARNTLVLDLAVAGQRDARIGEKRSVIRIGGGADGASCHRRGA